MFLHNFQLEDSPFLFPCSNQEAPQCRDIRDSTRSWEVSMLHAIQHEEDAAILWVEY